MFLQAKRDIFNNPTFLTSQKLRNILDLLDEYMGDTPYYILEIREDDVKEKNGRIDIEILYEKEKALVTQKLLLLNGEIIDGITFHKRFEEWYPRKITDK